VLGEYAGFPVWRPIQVTTRDFGLSCTTHRVRRQVREGLRLTSLFRQHGLMICGWGGGRPARVAVRSG
jgi:hypothetical protein